jgi:hypothetical protein
MTEYEEICNGKSVAELKEDLAYQINKLGFSLTDSYPQYLQEQITKGDPNLYNIKFKGIDDWNRPVYKVLGLNVYIGDVNNLFNWDTPKETVDDFYKKDDNIKCLCIFGSTFNKHDPLGTNLKKDIILNIV